MVITVNNHYLPLLLVIYVLLFLILNPYQHLLTTGEQWRHIPWSMHGLRKVKARNYVGGRAAPGWWFPWRRGCVVVKGLIEELFNGWVLLVVPLVIGVLMVNYRGFNN